jgi:hypothetical protein
MRTQGWVGPLIGLIVCLILLWILVPATAGILHTLLYVILLIGAVASARLSGAQSRQAGV